MLYVRDTPPHPADPSPGPVEESDDMVWDKKKIAVGVILLLGFLVSCFGPEEEDRAIERRFSSETALTTQESPTNRAARSAERRQARQEATRLKRAMTAQATRACVRQDGEPAPVANQSQAVAVRCDVSNYVALIGWDGDDNNLFWTRWWRIGTKPLRVLGRAFSQRSAARVPTPSPP